MASAPKRIAVLGAGITGLTAALRLTQQGHSVRVLEASPRVGGVIRSESTAGWLVEAGPNSLLAGDPMLDALIRDVGLESERVPASVAARNRYILRGGKLFPVPLSPPALIKSRLFSGSAKLRVFGEMITRPRARTSDLSLEEFIRSHFGGEIVEYGLNPFVTGVYAGNPKKLSARHAFPALWDLEQKHGSLLRGQMAAAKARRGKPAGGIISFRRGLQMLPDAIASRLAEPVLALNAHVETLLPGETWNVIWRNGTSTRTETFDSIIAALPAPALAQLRFGTLGERPLATLDTIEHPPVSSLFLGFRREQVTHALDGFGLLVPEVERRSILGVLFSSTLFAGRAPEGHVALTVLVGGTRNPELGRLPTEKLTAIVMEDLRALLGVAGEPVFQRHTFWPRAIPQYNLGYERYLDAIATVERTYPGLFVGGQARDGISLPACIAAGERLARAAEAHRSRVS